LYVPGKILDNNKVIVELGTNYYCEKTVDEAKELIERKITLISQSIETIEGVGLQKKKNLSQIIQIIQYKAAQANES
jgi:prefoldin alpha subunit